MKSTSSSTAKTKGQASQQYSSGLGGGKRSDATSKAAATLLNLNDPLMAAKILAHTGTPKQNDRDFSPKVGSLNQKNSSKNNASSKKQNSKSDKSQSKKQSNQAGFDI